MKSILICIALILGINRVAHAQFTLKWTSPDLRDSVDAGWTQTAEGGPLKFFTFDWSRYWQGSAVNIMNGPFSTTVDYSISTPPGAINFRSRSDVPIYEAADVSGDGIFDFVVDSYAVTSVVDPVSGVSLLTLEDASYYYFPLNFSDIDQDGKLEFIVYRSTNSYPRTHNLLVYGTNAPATSVRHPPFEPVEFRLSQNYPNPFNLTTTIEYALEGRGWATLTIYDAVGREVRHYHQGLQEAGHYTLSWDGRDNTGRVAATGTYFYNLSVDGRTQPKKMILLK